MDCWYHHHTACNLSLTDRHTYELAAKPNHTLTWLACCRVPLCGEVYAADQADRHLLRGAPRSSLLLDWINSSSQQQALQETVWTVCARTMRIDCHRHRMELSRAAAAAAAAAASANCNTQRRFHARGHRSWKQMQHRSSRRCMPPVHRLNRQADQQVVAQHCCAPRTCPHLPHLHSHAAVGGGSN
jgi:hypothetical protein